MRLIHTLLLAAGLVLAGCRSGGPDLSRLPQDALERATLCFGAAHAFWRAGEAAGVDAAELERRRRLEERIRTLTDYDILLPAGGARAVVEEWNRRIDAGNWLPDLNRCIEAYAVGEPEEPPALPRDPDDRLLSCAFASAVKSRGEDTAAPIHPYDDPQGFHFLLRLAGRMSGEAADQRLRETGDAVATGIIRTGAVDAIVDRCVAEHPLAALDHRTQLPEDDHLRAEICTHVTEVLISDNRTNRMKAAYMPRALRLDAPLRAALDAPVSDRASPVTGAELEAEMAGLGPSTSIFAACERAYLRE